MRRCEQAGADCTDQSVAIRFNPTQSDQFKPERLLIRRHGCALMIQISKGNHCGKTRACAFPRSAYTRMPL